MTAIDTRLHPTLTVLSGEASGLIRAEVRANEQRERLYKGVRDAVLKLGLSINEVSAATGLTPTEIRRVLDEVPAMDDLAELAGVS